METLGIQQGGSPVNRNNLGPIREWTPLAAGAPLQGDSVNLGAFPQAAAPASYTAPQPAVGQEASWKPAATHTATPQAAGVNASIFIEDWHPTAQQAAVGNGNVFAQMLTAPQPAAGKSAAPAAEDPEAVKKAEIQKLMSDPESVDSAARLLADMPHRFRTAIELCGSDQASRQAIEASVNLGKEQMKAGWPEFEAGQAPLPAVKELQKNQAALAVACEVLREAKNEAARWSIPPKGRLVTTKSAVDTLSKISDAVNLADSDYCEAFGAIPDRSAILLTGATGVGKTAGIKCLASYTGNPLVRINLHDNTDELELFGGYKPNPKGPGFVWVDGLVTTAVRNGYWIMLDELNLADPAVLERLNALLDGDDFVKLTEKSDAEVVRAHKDLRVFATMNPRSYEGRKDLSAAMKDRFKKKIWVDGLPPEEMVQVVRALDLANGLATTHKMDYGDALALANKAITGNHDEDPMTPQEEKLVKSIPSRMDEKTLMSLAMFHSDISKMSEDAEIGKEGGPYPFTLRDLLKLVNRVDMDRKTKPNQDFKSLLWRHAVDIYVNRFMEEVDQARVLDQLGIALFGSKNNRPSVMVENKFQVTDKEVTVGETTIPVRPRVEGNPDNALIPKVSKSFTWTHSTIDKVSALARSAVLDEPVLIVGPTAAGKTTGIRQLAALTNTPLHRFNLSDGTDSSQLIGGYYPTERRSTDSYIFKNGILVNSKTNAPVEGQFELRGGKLIDLNTGQAMFEWKDGTLVEAMRKGHWVILDEINLAEPSVLERLNSLLDPDRMIVLSEKDGERVQAAPGFRLFGTMNPPTAEYEGRKELSPAMRNRFTERWYPEILDKGELTAIANKMMDGAVKVTKMDMDALMPAQGGLTPMPADWTKKVAGMAVDVLLELRAKAESGELVTAHEDGYRYTIRSLETFIRYVRTHPDGLVTPDPKNIKKTITFNWQKTFSDAVKYTYADGLQEVEDRKAVEALGAKYAQKL
ncbi:MAG: AAA family ATPase [Candidatus Eremiobacterota bacterium]